METKIQTSSKWRNTVTIKHLFQDETTPELIITICGSLIAQLKLIKEREEKRNLTEDEKYNIDGKMQDVIGNFEHLRDLANGSIHESEWHNYGFDGNYEDDFNGYLSDLYDLGDERVLTTGNVLEKFLFVE